MAIDAVLLERVVASAKDVSPEDVRRALAIACLAVAADGKLRGEEIAALRVMSTALHGLAAASLDSLLQGDVNLSRDDRIEQLRAAADSLTTDEARHLAYKMTIATSLADAESSDEEFEFDLDVQEALSLAPATADRLTAEVHQALSSR